MMLRGQRLTQDKKVPLGQRLRHLRRIHWIPSNLWPSCADLCAGLTSSSASRAKLRSWSSKRTTCSPFPVGGRKPMDNETTQNSPPEYGGANGSADDFRKIYHCIGLLNSMVRGGERHSDTSARMTVEALEALERMEQRWPMGWTALKTSATDKCQTWLRSHSRRWPGACIEKDQVEFQEGSEAE